MNLRDLQYFVSVAETSHFGQAADMCCVSQPTLSMQLKKLEEELGVKLFERSNKQVVITPIGKDVLVQARMILGQVDQLKLTASHAHDPFAGRLRLGIIPTLGPYLLPQILKNLHRKFPKLDLVIFENKTENILKELRQGALDAVILAAPIPTAGLVTYDLFAEKFYAALPAQHRLSKLKKIKMDDIEDEGLLLLEEGHCLREQALDACRFSGAVEKEGFRATSLETIRQLVAAGSGITLLPEMAIRSSATNPLIVIKPFVKPEPKRDIIMCWRENTSRQECCEAIAEQIIKDVVVKVRE